MKALAVIGIVLGAITAIALFAIYNAWVLSI